MTRGATPWTAPINQRNALDGIFVILASGNDADARMKGAVLEKVTCLYVVDGFNRPGHNAPNAKLTDDEERARDARIGRLGWPRSSSFGQASC